MRIIKFLLSFSLFCVLFSLLPLLLQSPKPFLKQFLFTYYTIDKGYMFILCNGLLVFIAKNSGLMNASSISPTTIQGAVAVDHDKSYASETNVAPIVAGENKKDLEIEYQQPPEKMSLMRVVEGQHDDGPSSGTQGGGGGGGEEEEEEEEEEGNALLNLMVIEKDKHAAEEEDTEELNKKCEDFIRKMKAAFCSEPIADYYTSFDFDSQKSVVALNY